MPRTRQKVLLETIKPLKKVRTYDTELFNAFREMLLGQADD
jgi:hypothetical protein